MACRAVGFRGGAVEGSESELDVGMVGDDAFDGTLGAGVVRISPDKPVVVPVANGREVMFQHPGYDERLVPARHKDRNRSFGLAGGRRLNAGPPYKPDGHDHQIVGRTDKNPESDRYKNVAGPSIREGEQSSGGFHLVQ